MPLYVVCFFGYIGYSLIITIFTPLFLHEQNNGFLPADASERVRILALGFMIFLYPFGQFISSPILGALSDRFGRRPLLIFSLLISTLVYSLIGIAIMIKSFSLIAVSLFIVGLSEGNTTIAQSTVADLSPIKDRSRFFGYIYFTAALSYVIGPLLGGKFASPKVYSHFSFETPFFVVSFLLFCTFIWIVIWFKETHEQTKREKISYFAALTNLKNLFKMHHFRYLFFANFLLYLSIFGFFQSFPIYIVTRFGVKVGMLSLLIAWTSVPFVIVNLWLTGLFARWFTPVQVTIYSALFSGVSLIILLLPNQLNALWITLFLVGLGIATTLPASSAILSTLATPREQGRVMGINQSLQFLSEAAAGIAVGILASIFVQLSLTLFAFLSFTGAAALYMKKRH